MHYIVDNWTNNLRLLGCILETPCTFNCRILKCRLYMCPKLKVVKGFHVQNMFHEGHFWVRATFIVVTKMKIDGAPKSKSQTSTYDNPFHCKQHCAWWSYVCSVQCCKLKIILKNQCFCQKSLLVWGLGPHQYGNGIT